MFTIFHQNDLLWLQSSRKGDKNEKKRCCFNMPQAIPKKYWSKSSHTCVGGLRLRSRTLILLFHFCDLELTRELFVIFFPSFLYNRHKHMLSIDLRAFYKYILYWTHFSFCSKNNSMRRRRFFAKRKWKRPFFMLWGLYWYLWNTNFMLLV